MMQLVATHETRHQNSQPLGDEERELIAQQRIIPEFDLLDALRSYNGG